MKEIRVCWVPRVHHHELVDRTNGLWMPDTPDNRRDLEVIVEVACEVYGEGSHWLEEREA